ncbi:MAG: hypothetical protein ABIS69_10695 [Sediminibacterium sp.]
MVLVYKTTVDTQAKARKLKPYLDELLMPVKWNFDLSDCDRILRVEGPPQISDHVIHTLHTQGYACIELD